MNIFSPITQKTSILLFFSALFGGSLSVLFLFNLPLFYEQDRSGWIRVFILTFVIFSIIVALSSKVLLNSPAFFKEKDAKPVLLLISLSLLLSCIFYFTGDYYWSTPQFQHVEICYEASDTTGILKINSIVDYQIGRNYPARIVGNESFPISIPANTCIAGGIRTVQKWRGITINLDEQDADDFIIVKINRQNTLRSLADNDGIAAKEAISLPASAYRGSPIYPDLFSSGITIIIKWSALLLSSFYLAMFILVLTEIISTLDNAKKPSHRIALALILLYFMLFGFIMANHGGQPDQTMHQYYSSRYSETWGFPKEDPESYYYVTDNEYLYYWINGKTAKLYHLLVPIENRLPDRLLWRIMSVLMSTGTLYFIYKLTSRVTKNKWGGILAAFFCANTLMFVFVSGGVSYDNLMNLASAAAIYHLVCLIQKEDYVKNSAWLGIWLCLGSVAKNQVALLAFILFWIWLVYSILNRKILQFEFSPANIILTIILVFATGLFLEFYGGNLIKYHRPIPQCKQVKDPQFCTAFSFRRDQYQEVDYGELWSKRNEIVGPIEYASGFWLHEAMVNGIWGIVSHKSYVPNFTTSLHVLLIVWAVLCTARYWRKEDFTSVILLSIIIGYGGYVFFMNYNSELHYNFRHYAVQGRYLFPVFSAFLALMMNSFLNIPSLFLKRLTLALAIILYFGGGLGTFIFRYSDVFIGWRIFF